MELFQTESNYVDVLQTIICLFKEGIEDGSQSGGPLLCPQDVKLIFGEVPAIYDIHQQTQKKLAMLLDDWEEDNSIGKVFLDHADELQKRYPPFVNFFENTKETIERCEQAHPRFQAFLKRCLERPECGRQTLAELLIRPVQRLPSIILLLGDLLKDTPNTNPDRAELEKALDTLKLVMTHINEVKRKTECQITMLDVINDIENVPPTLLNSQRTFLSKVDVRVLDSDLAQKADHLTILLFSDSLEICKKRSDYKDSPVRLFSPVMENKKKKGYKHIHLFPLRSVRKVINIEKTFVFFVRQAAEEDRTGMHAFEIVEERTKSEFLCNIMQVTRARTIVLSDYGDDQDKIALKTGEQVQCLRKNDGWVKIKKTSGETGWVPKGCVRECGCVSNAGNLSEFIGFHGSISRSDAKYLLSRGTNGSFLIRDSESSPGQLSLSLRYEGRVYHYRVRQDDDKFFITVERKFTTLKELVKHHSHYPDGLVTSLLYPANS